jgi:RNA polymerase sigma-70 factor (ECF subfamily)
LRRMVELRLYRRLQARLDASDVIQDAYLEITRRLGEYLREPKLPLFLWLRLVVGEQIIDLHRRHLGAQMRDPDLEVSLYRGALPAASSAALAVQLLGKHTSPTEAAVRAERLLRIQEALNRLDPVDREVLSLRHFEHLNRAESAQVLGIEEEAAAKRYIRALKRLKDVLADMPGGLEGL